MKCNEVYGISSLSGLNADTHGSVSDQLSFSFCIGCKGDYKMRTRIYPEGLLCKSLHLIPIQS
jgi:hypothetical protein